jgi:hypothetical protein
MRCSKAPQNTPKAKPDTLEIETPRKKSGRSVRCFFLLFKRPLVAGEGEGGASRCSLVTRYSLELEPSTTEGMCRVWNLQPPTTADRRPQGWVGHWAGRCGVYRYTPQYQNLTAVGAVRCCAVLPKHVLLF